MGMTFIDLMKALSKMNVPKKYKYIPWLWPPSKEFLREMVPKDPDELKKILYEADLGKKFKNWEKYKEHVYGFLTRIGAENASNEFTLDMDKIKCRDWLGAGMTKGKLFLHGDVGDRLGSLMSGGTIHVMGNVGNDLGWGMKNGRIIVEKNAGKSVGYSMDGGVIMIKGEPQSIDTYIRSTARSLVVVSKTFEEHPKVYWNFLKGSGIYHYKFDKEVGQPLEWSFVKDIYLPYQGVLNPPLGHKIY